VEQLRVLVGEPLLVIDFRYHLVSLIAVFLAVALGIVIGTTALNEPILKDIEKQVSALEQDKRGLEDRTQQLKAELDVSDAFEEAVAPALVNGTLAGRKVLFVVADDGVAPETLEATSTLVDKAGGVVTGTLTLNPEYTDPSSASAVQGYVTGEGRPAGVQLPETDDTGKLVGSLLAQVLMVPADGGAAPDVASLSSVLAGLTALDVLTLEGDSVTAADYAVVFTGNTVSGSGGADRVNTLVDLVSALDAAGSGAVVAGGPGTAAKKGLVGAIRSDPTLSAAVSTVDNVDSAAGRISAVLALGQEGKGTSGQYGTGQDTQPVPPVPASTP
jgi:hypothetical protein